MHDMRFAAATCINSMDSHTSVFRTKTSSFFYAHIVMDKGPDSLQGIIDASVAISINLKKHNMLLLGLAF